MAQSTGLRFGSSQMDDVPSGLRRGRPFTQEGQEYLRLYINQPGGDVC